MKNSPLHTDIRANAFQAALTSLRKAKSRHVQASPHRAIRKLPVGPSLAAQAILLPLSFCALLLWAEPHILEFWRSCILFWSQHLAIPLSAELKAGGAHQVNLIWSAEGTGAMPDAAIWTGTLLLTLLMFGLSFLLNQEKLPLKYVVRIVCGVQAMALLYFWLAPSQFPYTVSDHLHDLISMGLVLIFAAPVMLSIGYYILNQRLSLKILHTILLLMYLLVMVPHQAVLHVLILQHFSLLYMPVLYICFGAVFDTLIFVALYAWIASTLPAQATD